MNRNKSTKDLVSNLILILRLNNNKMLVNLGLQKVVSNIKNKFLNKIYSLIKVQDLQQKIQMIKKLLDRSNNLQEGLLIRKMWMNRINITMRYRSNCCMSPEYQLTIRILLRNKLLWLKN